MQLVIGVGEFGLNVACQFFSHLVVEHNLLNLLQDNELSKKQKLFYDYSPFFSESNQLRANLLLFDTQYDPYLTILKNHPFLVPFLNRSQVTSLSGLPGSSHHKLLQAINTSMKDYIRDCLRKELEARPYQTILVFHSISGGTGSGLGSCLLATLQMLKSKSCNIVNIMLVPSDSQYSHNSLEWYNAAAGLETVSDTCDLTILLDNQALYRVYLNSLLGQNVDLNIRLEDLNCLIVQMIASLTGSQRYKSDVSKKFQDIIVNTVLYRCIHFVVPSLFDPRSITQPFKEKEDNLLQQQITNTNQYQFHVTPEIKTKYGRFKFTHPRTYNFTSQERLQNYTSPSSILIDLFDRRSCLATCDEFQAIQHHNPKDKYVSAFTSFNTPHEETLINQAFVHTKEYLMKATQIDFMSMSPCPFSFSLTHQEVFNWRAQHTTIQTQNIEMGACMLENKFTIHNIFDRIHRNVSQMYSKKSFLQWVDCEEVQKQIDGVKCLERDYGDWIQAEEIVHLFEESLRDEEVQSQSDSLSDSF